MSNYYGLILAGGRGTRFWPRSRTRHPKQVLSIAGELTLIQETVQRLEPLIPQKRIWVLTNDFVRDEIVRQLPGVPPEQIISEPAGRNTAPAVALAAHILASVDPDAVFGVFPSDHVIGNPQRFLELLRPAFAAAEAGKLAVLGVKPLWAETGYGYIQFPEGTPRGVLEGVAATEFCEKPLFPEAARYVAAGNYSWNAGMFFWRADAILAALRKYLPKTTTIISSLPPFRDPQFSARLAESFPLCEKISIDYAVMQKAAADKAVGVVGVVCDDFGWNDAGSWEAVYQLLPKDVDENVGLSTIISVGSKRNYVDCGGKVVALVGVEDLIVVDTPDGLLIARRDAAQRVGEVPDKLEADGRGGLT